MWWNLLHHHLSIQIIKSQTPWKERQVPETRIKHHFTIPSKITVQRTSMVYWKFIKDFAFIYELINWYRTCTNCFESLGGRPRRSPIKHRSLVYKDFYLGCERYTKRSLIHEIFAILHWVLILHYVSSHNRRLFNSKSMTKKKTRSKGWSLEYCQGLWTQGIKWEIAWFLILIGGLIAVNTKFGWEQLHHRGRTCGYFSQQSKMFLGHTQRWSAFEGSASNVRTHITFGDAPWEHKDKVPTKEAQLQRKTMMEGDQEAIKKWKAQLKKEDQAKRKRCQEDEVPTKEALQNVRHCMTLQDVSWILPTKKRKIIKHPIPNFIINKDIIFFLVNSKYVNNFY